MIGSWMAPEWIVGPMREFLTWLQQVTGSWGWAIILLTLAVRVVILPLTVYQTKSMKKMQEMQPKLKELQEKYKDQPEKLNAAMMEMYKSEGANPFAGCLPLLIQMPFLWAIFAVLQSTFPKDAVEPFLWFNLAAADPFYILPGITIASMFLQSWLGGVGTDPNQKMMMWMMPIFFGWVTVKMQSGVVLYWVISTIFGLIQQAIYPGFPRMKGAPGTKGAAGAR